MASDRHMEPVIWRWRERGQAVWQTTTQAPEKEDFKYNEIQPLYSAEALANAERDGMRRAAEIARETFHEGTDFGNAGNVIARAILSQAGEGSQ